MSAQISRRQFLKTGCIAAAAMGITLCGGGTLAATYQPTIGLPSATYGDPANAKRLLIAYATKAGSTAETAAQMGEGLSQRGLAVDVQLITKVTDLSLYHAIIVGSAIRTGQVLPEVMTFVEKNRAALQQKPFSVFVLCMTLATDNAEDRKTVSAYLDPVRALVKPAHEGLFAGTMNPNKLKLFERLIVGAMKIPTGDFRQWDQINTWAESASVI